MRSRFMFAMAATIALVANVAWAQLGQRLLGRPGLGPPGAGAVEIEAVIGRPFGVGVVSLPATPGERLEDPAQGRVMLSERSGRMFYPAYEAKPGRQMVRNLLGTRQRLTVFFLFTGEAPLELTLLTPSPHVLRVAPRGGNHPALLRSWWQEYTRGDGGDYPQLQNFMVGTLARRLSLPLPPPSDKGPESALGGELSLLAGSDSLRLAVERQMLSAAGDREEKLDVAQPVVRPMAQLEAQAPNAGSDTAQPSAVEPIAMRVPEECLYVRTGSFPNYLWLRHRLDDWGGSLRNIVFEQAVDYGLDDRLQKQIGMRESALAGLLGPSVIADVAIIGTDTFMREGAAMGVLFQARNNSALAGDIRRQRAAAAAEDPQASEKQVEIAGRQVSLVSTPDNRMRSFYAADGDFHLVTTSRSLIERFLETGREGGRSLGASADFRQARAKNPLERDDAVFIYLSRAFFANLMSPHYQTEMRRRLRSVLEMELIEPARLMAQAEGTVAATPEQLIAAGYLPARFGTHNDGSRLVVEEGRLSDSLRGGRGTFLPIPDVPVEALTRSEADEYERFSNEASRAWGPIDPLMIAVHRAPSEQAAMEHVSVDMNATPLSPRHFATLSQWLGPPVEQRLAPLEGDLVSVQASLRGGSLLQTGEHILFFGMQDCLPGATLDGPLAGAIKMLTGQSAFRGYVGAWPQPGLLRLVGGAANLPTDPAGYSRTITGVWRRQFEQYTLLSLQQDVLQRISPQLQFEPSPRASQLWVRVRDLAGTNLGQLINTAGWKHAQKMSGGNLRLLSSLVEQLHVAPESALATAQRLLDAKLIDPTGGGYALEQVGSMKVWASKTAAAQPADYEFPALTWIRGLNAEGVLLEGGLALHAELEMPAKTEATWTLPSLPFSLPGVSGSALPPKTAPPKTAPAPEVKPPAPKVELPGPNDAESKREF